MKTSILLSLLILCSISSFAQSPKVQTSQMRLLGETPAIRDIIRSRKHMDKSRSAQERNKEVLNFLNERPPYQDAPNALPLGDDPLWKLPRPEVNGVRALPFALIEGLDMNTAGGVLPPDVNGDIGQQYYMQSVNATYILVTDKVGNKIDSFRTDMLWLPFGLSPSGDPIILYDETEQRWLITEFANQFENTLLVAISKTGDPLGEYFAYEFQTPNFPDYPKYGIWPNAYFVTTNEGQDQNMPIYFLDRQAMLRGDSVVDLQRQGFPKFPRFINAFQIATPANWEGQIAPPDSGRMYITRLYDDDWGGDLGQDRIEIWEAVVDWDNPNNTRIEGPLDIPLAPFDAALCNRSFTPCIPQPTSIPLFPLDNVLMLPVTYRNFGEYEAMTFSFTVELDASGRSGIRWVELRKERSNWFLYQEGTYATSDDTYAFQPTLTLNSVGDIALGFTTSSRDQFPSMRYTGRRAVDPLGLMTVEEENIAQSERAFFNSRWGDYASMSVDPVDGTAFWYSNMYVLNNGMWGTKITGFRITREDFDLAPISFTELDINADTFSASETVGVNIRNLGQLDVSDFEVALYLKDTLVEALLIEEALQPDSVRLISFSSTLDLSAVDKYPLMVITRFSQDSICTNDTLRALLHYKAERDISVSINTDARENLSCGGSLPIFVLNEGTEVVNSFMLEINLNGNLDTLEWTGDLLPDERILVSADNTVFEAPGTLDILVNVISVNGGDDQIDFGNTAVEQFEYNLGVLSFTLSLTFDDAPDENFWQLLDDSDNLLLSGGPYDNSLANQTITEQFCLSDSSCYSFIIIDNFGDGIREPGGYEIRQADSTIVAQSIQTGAWFFERNFFCTETCKSFDTKIDVMDASSLSAEDGEVLVTAFNAPNTVRYTLGGSVNFNGRFTNLRAGRYPLTVQTISPVCLIRDSVTVGSVVSTRPVLGSEDVIFEVAPNPVDDATYVRIVTTDMQPNVQLEIIDGLGRIIRPVRLGNYNGQYQGWIPLEGLSPGVYYLRFQDRQFRKMVRIVKL